MSRCEVHCPGGSVVAAAVAVVIVAVIGVAVAQVVASMAAAVMVAGFAALPLAVAAGVVVVRRRCEQVPYDRSAQRVRKPLTLPATRVQAALPRSQPAAITATRIWGPGEFTDARHRARVTRDGS